MTTRFLILTFLSALFVLTVAQHTYAQSGFDDPGARTPSGGAGDLVPVTDKVDGGIVALGSSSQVVVLLRNDAVKPLQTGDINLYPSSNVSANVSQNQCDATELEPGAVCAIALNVQGLQAGKFRIEMLVRHEGRSRLITATISGDVESSGDSSRDMISDIESVPPEIDFETLEDAQTLVKSAILRNVTSNAIEISTIYIESSTQSGYGLETDCETLRTGEACVVTVSWSPAQKGPSTGVIVVQHDGPTSVTSIPLTGEYDPRDPEEADVFPEAVPGKGLIVSSLREVQFGTDVESTSSITVSLVNVGDAEATLNDIRLSNNDSGVSIQEGGCAVGTLLKPIEACPLTITWEPIREGSILDDLQVSHTGARGILVLPVRGEAVGTINRDNKAIVLGDDLLNNVRPLSVSDLDAGRDAPSGEAGPNISASGGAVGVVSRDVRGALDGYRITSHGGDRAIVSGPGGSRVIFDGEESVIGGILWDVEIRSSAVKFTNGGQQVLLLFDRSLSSINQNSSNSTSTSTSSETN